MTGAILNQENKRLAQLNNLISDVVCHIKVLNITSSIRYRFSIETDNTKLMHHIWKLLLNKLRWLVFVSSFFFSKRRRFLYRNTGTVNKAYLKLWANTWDLQVIFIETFNGLSISKCIWRNIQWIQELIFYVVVKYYYI